MIAALYWVVLGMMLQLSPSDHPIERHGALALAIATVAVEESPLFKNDDAQTECPPSPVILGVSDDSRNATATRRDDVTSRAMQIYDGPKILNEDPIECVRTGYRMLRTSIRVDRTNPVAFYARGPRWDTEVARRISRDRMALARTLVPR